MKINIHAGHNPDGKASCGAVGLIKESTEARRVKNEVVSQLRQLGHIVYDCTVDNGISQSDVLTKIVAKCNTHTVDLDVSIHFNAGASDEKGNGKTTGTEAYIYGDTSNAKKYAERICEAIAGLGFKNRGVKTSTSIYVLKKTASPALLVECCFVDDKDDVQLYDYQRMAEAIVYGITGKRIAPEKVTEVDKEAVLTGAETKTSGGVKLYRVQVGAYSSKGNAETMQKNLKAAGFDAVIIGS